MRVRSFFPAFLIPFGIALLPLDVFAQDAMARQDAAADRQEIISNALRAAPAAISAQATVANWKGEILRVGTNDYTCLSDDPSRPGNAPMCLDPAWMAWADAWVDGTEPPTPDAMSFGYMLQGDMPLSNVDPFAQGPTEDNEWMRDAGPHIMVLTPDPAMLDGITTDHTNGGPWVMWKDTPYVHLMIPTAARD